MECLRQFRPHRRALRLSDLRRTEGLVVPGSHGIKWCSVNLLSGRHGLSLDFSNRCLQARTGLGNSGSQLRERSVVRIGLLPESGEFYFASKQLIGKAIELARMPIANPEFAVGTLTPQLETIHTLCYL